jgi:4-aminobutyrate aminotransferase-like enzyme/Ser/Thr protein kinase RdoA (MazF antagonist)
MTTGIQLAPDLLQHWINKYWAVTLQTIRPLPGEIDLNYRITTTGGQDFTFKVSRPGSDTGQIELQQAALQWINQQDIDLELPYPVPDLHGRLIVSERDEHGRERLLRMVRWVPGQVLAETNPRSLDLLTQIGAGMGSICRSLQGFDHPAAHRTFKWDIAQVGRTQDHIHLIRQEEQYQLATYFLDRLCDHVLPLLSQLRTGIIHNDANDYNVLIRYQAEQAQLGGIIDFGDAIHTNLVNELAVAIAYGVMDLENPLEAAAAMVKGFHTAFPLLEEEISLLYDLIAARLLISVTIAAVNKNAEPENTYLLISERPAWELLKKWRSIPAALAHYTFRQACGWEACPKAVYFRKWAEQEIRNSPLLITHRADEKITHLDLRVGSTTFGNQAGFTDIGRFDRTVQRMLEDAGADIGIGGYGEARPFYTTDAYQVAGNEGPEWRTVHLGLDIWAGAGRSVIAPIPGVVHSLKDNAGERDYGPTIILYHEPTPELSFYTLYGHLSADSLTGLQVGEAVEAGQIIARIGNYPVNGNWPPHLHFQIILDLLDWKGDFPGVAFPRQEAIWKSICPDPALLQPAGLSYQPKTTDTARLREVRRRNLGSSLSLSYDKPLHIVRGFGPYLYDHEGQRYLDTVNNVAHVGHEHPKVVRAGQQQMSVLNTNTRYLHEQIVLLAEDLLQTLPPELSVVHFVNSGSEANELALRMARSRPGRTDMIAVEVGYHGNTGACIDISSYKFDGRGGRGKPLNTQIVPMPDTYRGLYRGHGIEAGRKYADHLEEAIQHIEQAGREVAGFICESILSCGGQIVLPPGYLARAYELVRAAGGLCIADEVQVGFGRVGSHFWGFELQGVIPDIVTMGKPFGNGHPLAAVVCTREVADTFANGMEYFNTFGGNPVSCAIGRAVLEVIREENLQHNARQTGDYLRQSLLELQDRHRLIGDIRGPGLFQGIELVKDREQLRPAAREASYIANRMRELGILMSTDGPLHNVLKIKPPICFEKAQVNFLIDTLDRVLREDVLRVD